MTNEEAISYLENAVCELDAGIKIYSGTIKEEFIEQRECFITSLSALREQAERDKGCEYCKQVIATVKMDFETDSILGENKWFSSTRRPKYCPMCGRRLEAQRE